MSMYMLLYSGGHLPETDEETEAVTDAWGIWLTDIGDALVDGNPLGPKAKSLSPGGVLSDAPAGSTPSGYSLIRARSMDQAVEMAKGCPVKLSDASISIVEVA